MQEMRRLRSASVGAGRVGAEAAMLEVTERAPTDPGRAQCWVPTPETSGPPSALQGPEHASDPHAPLEPPRGTAPAPTNPASLLGCDRLWDAELTYTRP